MAAVVKPVVAIGDRVQRCMWAFIGRAILCHGVERKIQESEAALEFFAEQGADTVELRCHETGPPQ